MLLLILFIALESVPWCNACLACGGGLGFPIPCAFQARSKSNENGSIPCSNGKFCPAPGILPVAEANGTDINRTEIVALAQISFKIYHVTNADATNSFLVAIEPELNTMGIVTLSTDKSTIISVFRGTNLVAANEVSFDFANVIEDFIALLVDSPLCIECNVHLGFLEAYSSIADQMKANVKSLQSSFPNASKLVATGHSMGGAMATLFALDLIVNEGMNNISLVTFGSPRVGNVAFSQFANLRLGSTNWRVTYDNDMVTVFPLMAMGYKHVGAEVHYVPSGDGQYFLLPTGLDVDYSRTSISDHFGYSNMSLTSQMP